MFRDMHLTRAKQLGRLHEKLGREFARARMGDTDRRLEALKANDFEAYKELLRQTYGPLNDDDRFKGAEIDVEIYSFLMACVCLLLPSIFGACVCEDSYAAGAAATLSMHALNAALPVCLFLFCFTCVCHTH
jgi:hypothetical protein